MQQVDIFLNGTRDYTKIEGSTGPLVYPAGHLYVYTALSYITDHGKEIRSAQYIFAVIYILNLVAVFRLYHKLKTVSTRR